MKLWFQFLFAAVVSLSRAYAAPEIDRTPFEPLRVAPYDRSNKFSTPDELVSPRFMFPYEMRRASIDGEVILLVEIDEGGHPRKFSVFYASQQEFIESAIKGILAASWKPVVKEGKLTPVWFYRRALFLLDDESPPRVKPNQPPESRSISRSV